ncbi:MAG: hypothetical protein KF894_12295 [Labilithrix sp.]|nr:hypothetical protein [Labilithrix sp.]
MYGDDSTARRHAAALGVGTGFALALVVSCGIVFQRVLGFSATDAAAANALTTLGAVVAVVVTVRAHERAALEPAVRERRVTSFITHQALGAMLGVLATHALVRLGLEAHPWLHEHPRQLVNDLVAVFGVFAFVWGAAQKPLRPQVMIAGLALVLGYELTAAYWHLDAPLPEPGALAWSVQRFVGSEVTASGVGVLAFRLLLA